MKPWCRQNDNSILKLAQNNEKNTKENFSQILIKTNLDKLLRVSPPNSKHNSQNEYAPKIKQPKIKGQR